MNDEMKVRFWGVRGSYPTPGSGTLKYGGNTACVEIQAGGCIIILDAGTGIIPLGRELARRAAVEKHAPELLVLFSHLHQDHTQGFPFFVPAYLPGARLHILGPDGMTESLKQVLEHNQSAESFPVSLKDMASAKNIQAVHESQVIVWDEEGLRVTGSGVRLGEEALVIHIHKSYAHPGNVFIYRISWRGRSLVYATDTEGYIGTDRKLVTFAHGADMLIHDAQYNEAHYAGQLNGFASTQGFGHSTATMACEVAVAAQVGQLALFHHDPGYSDDMVDAQERTARANFPQSYAAREGLEIKIPSSSLQKEWNRSDVQYVKNG